MRGKGGKDMTILSVSGLDGMHVIRIPIRSCHEWLFSIAFMRYMWSRYLPAVPTSS